MKIHYGDDDLIGDYLPSRPALTPSLAKFNFENYRANQIDHKRNCSHGEEDDFIKFSAFERIKYDKAYRKLVKGT